MAKEELHSLAEKAITLAMHADKLGDQVQDSALRTDIYNASGMIMKGHERLREIIHDFDGYGDYSLNAVLQRVTNGTSGPEDAAMLRRLFGTKS